MDLTQEQINSSENKADDELDEMDLLDATIDPHDIETQARVNEINDELRYEEAFIKARLAFRSAKLPSNPFNIGE